MLSSFSSVVLVILLPFLIDGIRSATTNLEFTPTTNPAPLPTASPILFLADLGSPLSTCTNQNVAWSYDGPSTRLVIAVTNFGVPQGPPPTISGHNFTDKGSVAKIHSRDPTPSTITNIIAQNLDAYLLHTKWKVNVPSGWYQIVVNSGDQRLDQTDAFYIEDGPDTSCLVGVPAGSSSSSASTSPSSTTSQAPQETVSLPTPVASASKDNHVGVIIGVVAGVVVALIIILIGFLCLRRRKNAQGRPSIAAGGLRRGWGGLESVTSIHSVNPDRTSRDLAALAREPAHHTEEGAPTSGSSTPFSLEEKVATSPDFSSRNPFDDAEGGITLATLPSNARRSASLRSSLQHTPPLRNPSIDAIVSAYDVDASLRSTNLSSSRHNSLTATEMMPSYSTSSSSVSPTERNKAERDSAGPQSAVRKTPRKPVPAYDLSLHTSSTPSPYLENSSPLVRTPSTPIAVSSFSGQGHYAKKAHLNASTPEGIDVLPRKSSFGPGGVEGKPVHYLMPDMPLPNSG